MLFYSRWFGSRHHGRTVLAEIQQNDTTYRVYDWNWLTLMGNRAPCTLTRR
jgi:mannose-6-phosphate isomerase class I